MNKTAMIVDDSRAICLILAKTLGALGFQTTLAFDGPEALKKLEELQSPPALALVDWNMPGMTGLELVRQVRRQKHLDETVLMMITTENEMDKVVAALEAGANEYLMKPFTTEMIEEKLRLLGVMA